MLTHADSQARIDETPATSLTEALAFVAAADPDGIALTDAHRTVTHRETDRLTGALGSVLDTALVPDAHSGAGVGPVPGGDAVPIGVMTGHGVDGVLAMLGLLRAGRLFVVLDPHLPEARLMHVIRLAGITEIVADAENAAASEPLVDGTAAERAGFDAPETAAETAAETGRVHRLDELLAAARTIADSDDAIPIVPAARERGGRDALTIIFTSGSTGAPKGVVMTHRSSLVDAESQRLAFGIGPDDRVASVLPHGFAAGFQLVVASLVSGASVHIVDPRDTGVEKLVAWIADQRLTTLHCTPHLLRSVCGALDPADDRLRGLRMFATVGEAITGPDIAALRPFMGPAASFWNWTGSSETNVIAFNEIRAGEPVPDGPVPSGRIAFGKEVRILRPDGTRADVGETGDIMVVSDAMTSGYWGNPEQTATRAGVDVDGTPTWKQGDLGRFDAEGRITLLGRADDAVKVRGYLVEPSEVEAAIRRIDSVLEAAVIAVKNPPAPTRLVAYVVGRAGRRTASPAAIRRELRQQLPDYMVPGAIVPMIALPRNERGKVDRARLPDAPTPGSTVPAPVASAATASEQDAAQVVVGAAESTGTEMDERTFDQWELVIGQIWAEVLGLHAVGLDDDFAELGGDSLSAEEMLAVVQERIGVDLRSSEVLEHPTVRDFARRVRAGAAAIPSHPDIVKLTSGGSGAPIFCISGAGALSLTFLPLSRHLAGHDVYAFQQHGLERRTMPDWSIRAAARRYVELMRVVQPRGPYLLIGHSLGGLVALEIARMLTEAGEEIDHVVLLDTYLPRTTAEQGALEFARLPERQHSSAAVARLRSGIDRQVRRILPGGAAQLRRVGRRIRAYGAGVLQYDGQRQFDAFFDQAALMAKRYRVPEYDGRVTFVQADNNPDGREAWSPYLVGDMRWPRLASEHSSLLREPHVAELADVLRAAIDGEVPEATSR